MRDFKTFINKTRIIMGKILSMIDLKKVMKNERKSVRLVVKDKKAEYNNIVEIKRKDYEEQESDWSRLY